MWKRFEENQKKINLKIETLKKKIEEKEEKEISFKPRINKQTNYYKNENNDFLKRVEIYKFISEARKSEIKSKDKNNYNNNNNRNNNNNNENLNPNNSKRKISIAEVKKNIEERLKIQKIKDIEREEKYLKKMKEYRENEMLECTFTPKLMDTSIKMNKNLMRSRSQVINFNENDKLTSVNKILDTEASKKIKLENLDTSESNCNLKKQKSVNNKIRVKRSVKENKNKNTNKKDIKIIPNPISKTKTKTNSIPISNPIPKLKTILTPISTTMRKDYSISKLKEIPEKRNLKLNQTNSYSNNSFDLKGKNNNNKNDVKNKSLTNLNIQDSNNRIFVISKKESEIMMELMRPKIK
jgi:hypothetical protein